MKRKIVPQTCPGTCTISCPVCAHMFWQWAEKHTQAYGKRFADKPSFYDAAGKKSSRKAKAF